MVTARAIVPALVAALLVGAAAAQPRPSVGAAFDAARAAPGEVLTFTITLAGSNVPRPRRSPAPDFRDFQVLSGPATGRSTQVSMTPQGVTSSSVYTFSWQVVPRREGILEIPSVAVDAGGQVVQTPSARVEIGTDPVAPQSGAADPPTPAPQRRPPRARSEGSSPWEPQPRRTAGRLEVKALLDDREPWVGEEIVLSHVLDFDVRVTSYSPVKPAEFEGFSAVAREVTPTGKPMEDATTGERWQRAPLARWALVPLRAGSLEIPAQAYNLDIQQRDEYFPFFSGDARRVVRTTAATTIRARTLPDGAPASFAGAVGSFQLATALAESTVKVGDGTTLTLTVSGSGNFEAVIAPRLELPGEVASFDPEVRTDVAPDGSGRTTGKKVFEYPLLVREPGRLTLPPIRWAFFDPRTGRYVEREAPALELEALPTTDTAAAALGEPATSTVEVRGRDIHHVRPALRSTAVPGSGAPDWVWPALAVGPALFLAAAASSGWRRWARRDPASARVSAARGRAKQRLAEAKAHAHAGRPVEAADASARAVTRYVADRLLLGEAELSPQEAGAHVAAALGEAAGERVRRFLTECDFVRFAGVAAAGPEAARLVEEAGAVLSELSALAPRREAA